MDIGDICKDEPFRRIVLPEWAVCVICSVLFVHRRIAFVNEKDAFNSRPIHWKKSDSDGDRSRGQI